MGKRCDKHRHTTTSKSNCAAFIDISNTDQSKRGTANNGTRLRSIIGCGVIIVNDNNGAESDENGSKEDHDKYSDKLIMKMMAVLMMMLIYDDEKTSRRKTVINTFIIRIGYNDD